MTEEQEIALTDAVFAYLVNDSVCPSAADYGTVQLVVAATISVLEFQGLLRGTYRVKEQQ